MIRVLLACEGGSGLGHVTNLRTVAAALGPAFSFDGAHHHGQTLQTLAPYCDAVFPCPGLWVDSGRASAGVTAASWCWGNFLEACGFTRPMFLGESVSWWRRTMLLREIDLVVCDYAPRAQLAARTLGIPVVLTGTGYSVPPDGLVEFPAFMDRTARTVVDAQSIMDATNAICAIRGMRPLSRLPEFCDADVKLPVCIDLLDPYAGLRTGPRLSRPSAFSGELAGGGEEVFVYLSNVAGDPPWLPEALADLGARVRVYAPWASAKVSALLASGGAIVEDNPVGPDLIAARSRLVVHYGQPGTTSMALAAALPQVALPQHYEQLTHARLAAATGAVAVVPRPELSRERFVAAIRGALGDDAMAAAARRVAPEVRAQMSIDAPGMIRETLRPVLVDIIRRKELA